MNGLSNSTRLAGDDGTAPRLEGSRLAQGEATGGRPVRYLGGIKARISWPGRSIGIRRPEFWETPLSQGEVEYVKNPWGAK